MELCSTRTIGREAWSGIVGGRGVSVLGGCIWNGSACVGDGEVAIASTGSAAASSQCAGVTTAVSDTWEQRVYGVVVRVKVAVWERRSEVTSSAPRWEWIWV